MTKTAAATTLRSALAAKEAATGGALKEYSPEPEKLISGLALDDATGGMSATTRWRLTQRGEFPAPIQISPGRVAYRASEIAEWQRKRIEARDARKGQAA